MGEMSEIGKQPLKWWPLCLLALWIVDCDDMMMTWWYDDAMIPWLFGCSFHQLCGWRKLWRISGTSSWALEEHRGEQRYSIWRKGVCQTDKSLIHTPYTCNWNLLCTMTYSMQYTCWKAQYNKTHLTLYLIWSHSWWVQERSDTFLCCRSNWTEPCNRWIGRWRKPSSPCSVWSGLSSPANKNEGSGRSRDIVTFSVVPVVDLPPSITSVFEGMAFETCATSEADFSARRLWWRCNLQGPNLADF